MRRCPRIRRQRLRASLVAALVAVGFCSLLGDDVAAGRAEAAQVDGNRALLEPVPHRDFALRQRDRLPDRSPGWSVDGRTLAFFRGRAIFLVDLGRAHERRLAPGSVYAWSPTKREIAFQPGRYGYGRLEVWLYSFRDRELRRLDRRVDDYRWSPDGRSLATWHGVDEGVSGIWRADLEGAAPRQLAGNDPPAFSPAWSPDGTRIAHSRWNPPAPASSFPRSNIYVMTSEGSRVVRLTDTAHNYEPAWSPDGSMIAWAVATYPSDPYTAVSEVWLMSADGSDQRKLGLGDRPVWSPTGSRLAYQHAVREVQLIDVDGSDRVTIHGAYGPAWSPQGMHCFCSAGAGSSGPTRAAESSRSWPSDETRPGRQTASA